MQQGVKFQAKPTEEQKLVLSQWMGCARFIWNGKCDEERYHQTYARKYCCIGTYAPIDQRYAHFKDPVLSPWLSACPSQILRNSAVNWYETFQNFMQGQCGKPKRKPKTDKGSIHLTRELFSFETSETGTVRLFIGSKTNNIGYLSFNSHREYQLPNSLYITKKCGQYFVSFSYKQANVHDELNLKAHLERLTTYSAEALNDTVIGIDRGVTVPAQANDDSYDFTPEQKKNKAKAERYVKRLQRKLDRQKKGSKRRLRTKQRLARKHQKVVHIREDFCHKTSRSLVASTAEVFVFEDLKTKHMTKRPKAKQDEQGRFVSNKARQKAGLNRAILDKGWHRLETFTRYKAERVGKVVFKVAAHHTSQECADCGHTHPDNRKSQAVFHCVACGHIDNADRNASLVIKKRAINLILDTGTVLSDRGVLTPSDTGRGAKCKTSKGNALPASGCEPSKKKRTAAALAVA